MHTIHTIRDLYSWLQWCTQRTTDAARTLTKEELHREFPMGLGSVMGTLVHMYGAETLWLRVLEGTATSAVMPTAKDFATLDDLATKWRQTRSEWDVYLGTLTDAELMRVVVRVREGREFKQRVVDGLLQVPTHALYHNAQLSNMFRQMGHQLPDSSYIIWAREQMPRHAAIHA